MPIVINAGDIFHEWFGTVDERLQEFVDLVLEAGARPLLLQAVTVFTHEAESRDGGIAIRRLERLDGANIEEAGEALRTLDATAMINELRENGYQNAGDFDALVTLHNYDNESLLTALNDNEFSRTWDEASEAFQGEI